jgi:hypothetical protein
LITLDGVRTTDFVATSVARRCDHLLAPHSVVPVLFAAEALPSRRQQTCIRPGSDEVEIARLQIQAASIADPTALLLKRGGIAQGLSDRDWVLYDRTNGCPR